VANSAERKKGMRLNMKEGRKRGGGS